MTLPPDNPDPMEKPPTTWRRWLPFAAAAALVLAIVTVAVVSDDDDAPGNAANTSDESVVGSVGESVAPNGSADTVGTADPTGTADTSGTIDTSTAPVTTGGSATSVSEVGGPTSNAASTDPAVSSPAATNSPTSTAGTPAEPAVSSPIDLGRAADFALLGNTAVNSTGPTTVTGQIGASNGPTPSLSSAANPSGLIIVSAQNARQAQLAVDEAISAMDGLSPTALSGAGLASRIGPGTYSSATLSVSGTVTLDAGGEANALFVFESASTLTVAAGSTIVLAGGARACDVYWRIGSTSTLGSGSTLVGTFIADDSITAESGMDLVGRLIARNGSLTLDSDSIRIPDCA